MKRMIGIAGFGLWLLAGLCGCASPEVAPPLEEATWELHDYLFYLDPVTEEKPQTVVVRLQDPSQGRTQPAYMAAFDTALEAELNRALDQVPRFRRITTGSTQETAELLLVANVLTRMEKVKSRDFLGVTVEIAFKELTKGVTVMSEYAETRVRMDDPDDTEELEAELKAFAEETVNKTIVKYFGERFYLGERAEKSCRVVETRGKGTWALLSQGSKKGFKPGEIVEFYEVALQPDTTTKTVAVCQGTIDRGQPTEAWVSLTIQDAKRVKRGHYARIVPVQE